MRIKEIFESTNKHITFCFGRMNPPTIGHKKLMDAMKSVGGDMKIFVSQTQDKKKNPLDYATKIKFIRAIIPEYASSVVEDPSLNTIGKVASHLYNQGYRHATFVAGSDRLDEMSNLLKTYNGVEGKAHGFYKFDTLDFKSSGDREDGAEGVEGISASNARAAAATGDFEQFAASTGAGKYAKALYDAVRKGLGIKEGVAEGEVVAFPKKHKGDITNMHSCPKCGGDLQGGKYMGHQVQVCMPCKQVYLPPNSGIDQQGNKIQDEAYDHSAPFNAADFNRHMEKLRAREELKKTDPMRALVGDMIDKDNANRKPTKKADDDSMSINDPRHPGWTYTEIGSHRNTDEDVSRRGFLKGVGAAAAGAAVGNADAVAMRMQGSSKAEKEKAAADKAREEEEKRKYQEIVQKYVKIINSGQPLPPKMQHSYDTMKDFRKDVDTALANIPGQPGRVDYEQRKNYHLMQKEHIVKVKGQS